ncbi:MAG: GNAT family N-acetyltransferase [Hydrogenophaga sp.]|uniref:GNAT family N-acetyltransferase n=1 Tax=Hydrogenophaga sp. TaxID=1904254 RepID=UPI001DA898AF|nr:GNAT family N-acetyltransferase [Hydrogenophaga sp.]MBX3609815.1 GNAT family N-acetyltransferase [Hydrogenophaga sp.]
MDARDVDSLERATVQAVSPEFVDDGVPGWLLPMDHGTVGRAQCAVPLRHDAPDVGAIDDILARYASRGFTPAWRLPDLPSFDAFFQALSERGFRRALPTQTQVGDIATVLHAIPEALVPGRELHLDEAPTAAWMTMFLGEGLDPVDGASRSRALARAQGTLFASLLEHGETLACGAASYSHGWLGVHGMRTAASQRGRGMAGAVLNAMAREARRRGIERVFLQVTAHNTPALALYRRAGFSLAWPYAYWRR